MDAYPRWHLASFSSHRGHPLGAQKGRSGVSWPTTCARLVVFLEISAEYMLNIIEMFVPISLQ